MTDAIERVARYLHPVLFDKNVKWQTPHLQKTKQKQMDRALDEAREIVRLVKHDDCPGKAPQEANEG